MWLTRDFVSVAVTAALLPIVQYEARAYLCIMYSSMIPVYNDHVACT